MSERRGGMGRDGDADARTGGGDRLPPERLAALRDWVRRGGPDAPAVLEAVARRMIARGDV